jgi:hypothetical protein
VGANSGAELRLLRFEERAGLARYFHKAFTITNEMRFAGKFFFFSFFENELSERRKDWKEWRSHDTFTLKYFAHGKITTKGIECRAKKQASKTLT